MSNFDDKKKKVIENAIKTGKTPLSIEQAGNYLHHKDFKDAAMAKIEIMKDKPLGVHNSTQSTHNRALRVALACLPKKGVGLVYRQLLTCRIQGASTAEIARGMKMSADRVEELEKQAIDTVKGLLSKRKIIPVV